jgi:hypothetical protein
VGEGQSARRDEAQAPESSAARKEIRARMMYLLTRDAEPVSSAAPRPVYFSLKAVS